MEESIKCPICGKEGLPNFRKEDVVCPCCNSNLSIYHKIDELVVTDIPNDNNKKYKWLSLIFGITTIIVVGICIWFLSLTRHNYENNKTIALENEVACLKDSIVYLHQIIVHSKKENVLPENIYVVRKGDSFCKISKNILGSEARHKEIVKLNNLNVTTILHEGDTLKIPVQ